MVMPLVWLALVGAAPLPVTAQHLQCERVAFTELADQSTRLTCVRPSAEGHGAPMHCAGLETTVRNEPGRPQGFSVRGTLLRYDERTHTTTAERGSLKLRRPAAWACVSGG